MSNSNPNSPREAFLDELAAVASGDQASINRHLDLLGDDDEMRDLRHDATALAGELRSLGSDYEHPESFQDDLLAAVDAASEADTKTSPIECESKPEAQAVATVEKTTPIKKTSREPKKSRLRTFMWASGAAAAATLMMVASTQFASAPQTQSVESASLQSGVLSAKLIQTERSANDGASGVTIQSPGTEAKGAAVGLEIAAGSVIKTDSRTRVILQLSDTSTITLAPDSEVALDAHALRTLALRHGELVADVAHLEDGPNATFLLPTGHVEVLGTKFSLSADAEQSSVRVLRGLVALHGSEDRLIEISAGEEGSVDDKGTLDVAASLHVAETMRWSELGPEPGEDRSGSGLGELRAYKPGQSRDRDWPMALENHKVTVRLVGNVARTEIEEVFRNDSKTVLEGVYKFPLPAGAQIDKLALDVDGKFEDGAIVDKRRASKIWRGVIHRATKRKPVKPPEMIWVPGPWRDPAILEWQQGNRFELRIFPIPAKGTRTIKLAYTQTIAPQGKRRRYVYALPKSADGSSVSEHFDFDLRVAGIKPDSRLKTPGYEMDTVRNNTTAHLHLAGDAFVPNGDLVLDYEPNNSGSELRAWGFQGAAATPPGLSKSKSKQGPAPEVLAEQARLSKDGRGYALLSLHPTLPRWTEHKEHDYVIVLDSSQSMIGERFDRAIETATTLLSEMSRGDRVQVLACDFKCQSFREESVRPTAKNATELQTWLRSIEPAGASYLEHALEESAQLAGRYDGSDRQRLVVYIGDGIASMGHRSLAALTQTSKELRQSHRVAITTVGVGADSDSRALAAIARSGGGFSIEHRSGRRASHLAQEILETTMGVSLRDAELVLPKGLSDVSPIALSTLRAGDEFLITGRYAQAIQGDVILRGTVGGKPYENRFALNLPLSNHAANAFVPKLWATQTIERIETEGRAGSQDTIVAMSKSYGVMSKQTSLLVLESEAMFKAFGVDRAKPLVQWTGEEGEAEVVGSGGSVDFSSFTGKTVASSGSGKGSMSRSAPRAAASRSRVTLGDDDADDDDAPRLAAPVAKAAEKKAKRRPMPRRTRRPGRWMRKVWHRVPSIHRYNGVADSIRRAVDKAEEQLAAQPDSRDRHRSLIQALSYAEDLGRAEEVARSWLERDRLDPEALAYLADIAARRGRRDESLRVLSGVVDLRPDDKALHRRLAKAFQRVGDSQRACAHRVVLAELDGGNLSVLADAIRCENSQGRKRQAEVLLDATEVSLRDRVLQRAQKPAAREKVRGDLVVDASWTGDSDLDIAIITPRGRRISWQGGHRRVVAADVTRIGSERMGLRRIRKGKYLIEISRTSKSDTRPVHGQVNIELLGRRQRIPFDLHDDAEVVGRVVVRMQSSMQPM